MKEVKFILPVLVLLIGLAGIANAAETFVTPAGDGTISGDYTFNITSALDTPLYCLVTGTSAASGDTLASTNISTVSGTAVTGDIDTGALRDATDWIFDATCYNASGAGNSAEATQITGVEVGNTVPTITSCTIEGVTAANGSVDSSKVSVVCTIKNATSCNVYWKDTTANAMSTDYSDVDCTLTATSSYGASGTSATCDLLQAGDNYDTWYFDCTDGTDTTEGDHYKIKTEGYSKTQKDIKAGSTGTQTFFVQNKMYFLVGAVAIIMVLLLAAAFINNKKK